MICLNSLNEGSEIWRRFLSASNNLIGLLYKIKTSKDQEPVTSWEINQISGRTSSKRNVLQNLPKIKPSCSGKSKVHHTETHLLQNFAKHDEERSLFVLAWWYYSHLRYQNIAKFPFSFTKFKTIPANIYLFKVNDRNTRKRCEICLKLQIKTPE